MIRDYVDRSLQDVMASRQSGKILTGTLSAVQDFKSANGSIVECGVVLYGNIKILIPISDLNVSEETRKVVRSMIGAQIDFIVREINLKGKIARASRKDAMNLRKKLEFVKHKIGDKILVRVIGIGLNNALVEAYGVETWVKKEEIDWGYIDNIDNYLQIGDSVPAVIKTIDTKNFTIEVSIREAKEDPYEGMVNNISKNEECLATVTGIQDYGVFVKIGKGLSALCPYPHWNNFIPNIGDKYLVRIKNIDKAARKIDANLIRVIRKAEI